jgi:tyrosine-protein kinase Etk/Wzc
MTDQTTAESAEQEDFEEINFFDLLQVIVDNLRLLILGPLAVGFMALGLSFLITPTFTASTTFLPPQQQQSSAAAMLQTLGALGGVAGAATGIKSPADQYVAFLVSNSIKDALVTRFKLMERFDVKLRDDARKALAGKVRVSSSRKNGLITIEVDDPDPKFAADMANAYIEELTNLLGRLALTEAQARRVFFEQELKKAKAGLATAESALKATGINESAIKASPVAAVDAVANLMAQVAAKEVQLGAMRNYLTDSAPDLKRTQSELEALRKQLANTEKDSTVTNGGSDYVAKYRDFKYYETLFEMMAKQYEIARVDESREGVVIQVVDKALPPERKSKPKKASIAIIATLVAGFALLLLIFAREALRSAQRNPEFEQKLDSLRTSLCRALGRA